jgi:small subunit ribosomal protein S19
MAKKFTFKGKEVEELKQLSIAEFAELLPSNLRRSLTRGLNHQQQKLLDGIDKGKNKLRTHSRNLPVLPVMIGHAIGIYNGKTFVEVHITGEMLGLRLGELSLSRGRVQHSAPGIGATRGTASASVR